MLFPHQTTLIYFSKYKLLKNQQTYSKLHWKIRDFQKFSKLFFVCHHSVKIRQKKRKRERNAGPNHLGYQFDVIWGCWR